MRSLLSYFSVFIIFLLTSCQSNSVNGGEDELDEPSCNVNGFSAVGDYIATWQICEMDEEEEFYSYNRVTLLTLDESIQVQVSNAEYNSYSPLIWTSGNNLNIVYGKNTSDTQGAQFFVNQIIFKTYTLDGEFVSEETLMEVEPGRYGTFQMPFRKIERGPSSTVVYWADNEVESVARTANLFEIEYGEVTGNQYLTGVHERSVNTPYAINKDDYYMFAFMSGLTPEEMRERDLDSDQNSIFIAKSDKNFQVLGEEQIINVAGESDWGTSPSVAQFDEKYAVVFRSANQPTPNLGRLNLRIYDPESEEVIHSEVWDRFTYLNHQTLTDAAGNLMIFYMESDHGFAANEYNLRVKIIEQESLEAEDRFIMAAYNPNFEIERLDQDLIRLYYGEASGRIVAGEFNLNSFAN